MQAFENEYLILNYLEKESTLHAEWLRNVSSEEYREGIRQSVECLKKYQATYWLIDARHLQGIRMSDQHWIQQEIVPLLKGLSVRKLARVASSDIFNYMSFEEVADKAAEEHPSHVDIAQFTSMEAARTWLQLYEN